MCGIAGSISKHEVNIIPALDTIVHRGPDHRGISKFIFDDFKISMGHQRLSIIDLSAEANQPFISESGRYVICFNGEIYNYKDLKTRYLSESTLATSSDTEVLIELFAKYGSEMVSWLNGIFVFVIYDQATGKVFFARDQLGVKPLYVYQESEILFFASEIKALTAMGVSPEVDESAISEYLLNGYLYEPDTGFKNIKKLSPGTTLTLTLGDTIKSEYWSYWKPEIQNESTYDLDELIKDSVREQLVSDVPVGLFFSGGVDSSVILAEVKDTIRSFSIKYAKDEIEGAGVENDYHYAQEIAKHLGVDQLEDIPFEKSRIPYLDAVELLVSKNEELISDFTYFASEMISKQTKDKGITVALSGMGADELFGGYPRYMMIRYDKVLKIVRSLGIHRLANLVFRRVPYLEKKADRFMSYFDHSGFIDRYTSLIGVFSKRDLPNLLLQPVHQNSSSFDQKLSQILEGYENSSPLKKAMLLDRLGFLTHNFIVADKSSMAASLELRVPLATHQLFDFALGKEDGWLVKGFTTKHALKEWLCNKLPSKLVHRRKAGFNPPLDGMIRSTGSEKLLDFMESRGLFRICDESVVKDLVEAHFNKQSNNTYQIHTLAFLAAWMNKHTSRS